MDPVSTSETQPDTACGGPSNTLPVSSEVNTEPDSADSSTRLDPNYEWIEVFDLGASGPTYIRGMCKHRNLTEVKGLLEDKTVARLCLACDAQLPGDGDYSW